jgi:hypothetical protein
LLKTFINAETGQNKQKNRTIKNIATTVKPAIIQVSTLNNGPGGKPTAKFIMFPYDSDRRALEGQILQKSGQSKLNPNANKKGEYKSDIKAIYLMGFKLRFVFSENCIFLILIFFLKKLKKSWRAPKGHIQPHQSLLKIIMKIIRLKKRIKYAFHPSMIKNAGNGVAHVLYSLRPD